MQKVAKLKFDATGKAALLLSLLGIIPVISISVSLNTYNNDKSKSISVSSSSNIKSGQISGLRYSPISLEDMQSSYRGELISKISGISENSFANNEKLKPIGYISMKLAEKYRIMDIAAERIVLSAFEAGKKNGVDPMLILAVAAVESRFNPISESGAGAMGMMQVIPKYHVDAISNSGGIESLMDVKKATYAGAVVLKKYLNKAKGNTELALTLYNGSISDTERKYAKKVIGLQQMFTNWYEQ